MPRGNIQIWMLVPAVIGQLNRARFPKRHRLKPKRGKFGEHRRECCTKAWFVVEITPGAVRAFDDALMASGLLIATQKGRHARTDRAEKMSTHSLI